jgi:hypothetical protein
MGSMGGWLGLTWRIDGVLMNCAASASSSPPQPPPPPPPPPRAPQGTPARRPPRRRFRPAPVPWYRQRGGGGGGADPATPPAWDGKATARGRGGTMRGTWGGGRARGGGRVPPPTPELVGRGQGPPLLPTRPIHCAGHGRRWTAQPPSPPASRLGGAYLGRCARCGGCCARELTSSGVLPRMCATALLLLAAAPEDGNVGRRRDLCHRGRAARAT